MYNKRTVIILSGLLILSFLFAGYTLYQKQLYEKFLSQQLANQISPLVSAIRENHALLDEIYNRGTITRVEATTIGGNFSIITFEAQDILYMGHRIKRIDNHVSNQIASTNHNYARFFQYDLPFEKEELEPEQIHLNPNQLEQIKEIKAVVDQYEQIVRDHIKHLGTELRGMPTAYWDEYMSNGIKKKDWVNLITQMERVTPSR